MKVSSMRLIAAAVVVAAVVALASGGVGAENGAAFVGGFEDMPLMAGLSETGEAGMVFDTPAGRIIETYATGAVSRDAVVEFYAATLPQLGWRRIGETEFRREGEVLRLEFPGAETAAGGMTGLTVRFALKPGSPAPGGGGKQ